jgi:DNA-binding MarR family transcriptional regulator
VDPDATPVVVAAQEVRTRVVVLLMRYSLELTREIERAAGVGTSGNHEVQVLTHLRAHGPSRRGELIALTGLSRSAVAQLLDRLHQLGLVESHRDARDHRSVTSRLTRSGRSRVGRMERMFAEYFASPNPLVKELLDLLAAPASRSSLTTRNATASIDAVGRLGAVGARISSRLDAAIGLTETRQRLALAALGDWGEARPGQLVAELGLTSGGTTYLVDQLESAGIVERLYGTVPTDRRAVVIRLTPSGQSASERFTNIVFEHADELVEALAAAHGVR